MSPETLDLIFTGLTTFALAGIAGVAVAALPWSSTQADASAGALRTLAGLPLAWLGAARRARAAPRPAPLAMPAASIALPGATR